MSEKKDVLNNNKIMNLFEIIKENNLENKNKNIFNPEDNFNEKIFNKEEKKNLFLSKKTFYFKTDKISDNLKKKSDNIKINEGRWSQEEHDKFLEGIELYGINWKNVKKLIDTRTIIQVRSHAQKFYHKMKLCKDDTLGINFTLDSICNIRDMINQIKFIYGNNSIKTIFNHLSNKYENYEKYKKKYIQKINNNSGKKNVQKNIINLKEDNCYNNQNIFQNNEINSLDNLENKLILNENIKNYNQILQNNYNLSLNNNGYFNSSINNNFLNNNFINNRINIGNTLSKDYNFNDYNTLLSNSLCPGINLNNDKNLLINNLSNIEPKIPYLNATPLLDELLLSLIINNTNNINNNINNINNFNNLNNINNNNFINQNNNDNFLNIQNNFANNNPYNFELNKIDNNSSIIKNLYNVKK